MISNAFPSFLPCRGMRSPHLQTLLAAYLPARLPYLARQHILSLADGDAIVLHDDCPHNWQPGHRVVLLLHGVAGCHGSPYLVRTAAKLNQRGFRTFRLDFRGRGAGRTLARKPANAGRSADVRTALDWVTASCAPSPITLVGYSMGGNVALKLLGEAMAPLPPRLDSCLAVAPPIDLTRCARNLDQGLQRLYSRALTRMLVRSIPDQKTMLESLPEPLPALPRRLWDFDDRITAPLSGFENAESYYSHSSAAPLLAHIQIPTLIVAAEDDPLIPVDMFRQTTCSAAVHIHLTDHGGHVGYFGRQGVDPDRWWLDWRIVDWIAAR